jgi:pyruvate formate lyase activating enzyme
VDLKSFDDRHYHELGGRLGPILDSIRRIHQMGFWLEVVTLVVPGFNDSATELTAIAEFLADISPDIPWHVTAFHEDYKMFGQGHTGAATLQRAAQIGRIAGLHYVYAGNLPGQLGKLEDTHCPNCGATVVERRGFRVLSNRLADGRCPDCAAQIAGKWSGTTTSHQPPTTSHGELCSPRCG